MKKKIYKNINTSIAYSKFEHVPNIMDTPIKEYISEDIQADDTLYSTIKKLNDKIDYLMNERDKVFLMEDIKKEIITNINQIVEDTIKEKLNEIIFMVSTIQEKNSKEKNKFSNLKLSSEDDDNMANDEDMDEVFSEEENDYYDSFWTPTEGIQATTNNNIGEQTTINFEQSSAGTPTSTNVINTNNTYTQTSNLSINGNATWSTGYFYHANTNLWALDYGGSISSTTEKKIPRRKKRKSEVSNIENVGQKENVAEQINYHKNNITI